MFFAGPRGEEITYKKEDHPLIKTKEKLSDINYQLIKATQLKKQKECSEINKNINKRFYVNKEASIFFWIYFISATLLLFFIFHDTYFFNRGDKTDWFAMVVLLGLMPGGLFNVAIGLILDNEIQAKINNYKLKKILEKHKDPKILKEEIKKLLTGYDVDYDLIDDKYGYKNLIIHAGNKDNFIYKTNYCHDRELNKLSFEDFKEREIYRLRQEKNVLIKELKSLHKAFITDVKYITQEV